MLCSLTTWAAKAVSIPVQVRQADGSVITVILRGDEHINWYTTLDGVLLVQGADNNYYIGKVEKSGNLIATKQLAHEALTRSQAERNLIAKQDKEKFFAYVNKIAEESENAYDNSPLTRGPIVDSGYGGVPYFPHTGSPKALVILAEFQDVPFTIQDTKKIFTNYLTNEGHFSDTRYGQNLNNKGVRGYFKDCSYGQFTPVFDVIGPVKLPKPQAVYGEGIHDRMDLLLPDVCEAVDDSVNFADYDANNDGMVDLVYVIYAGHSANVTGNKITLVSAKNSTVDWRSNVTLNGEENVAFYLNGKKAAAALELKTATGKTITLGNKSVGAYGVNGARVENNSNIVVGSDGAALYSTGATGSLKNTGKLTVGKNSVGMFMKDGTALVNSGEIVSTAEGAKGLVINNAIASTYLNNGTTDKIEIIYREI